MREALLKSFSAKVHDFQQLKYTDQLHQSTTVMLALQADILASVPQHLFALPSPAQIRRTGNVSRGKMHESRESSTAFPTTTIQSVSFNTTQETIQPSTDIMAINEPPKTGTSSQKQPFRPRSSPASRVYGGNFLMWPLWFAGVMDTATDDVRVFVIRNLREIGREIGIRQGYVLADMLEGKIDGGFEFV
jgi:hypothetical protein